MMNTSEQLELRSLADWLPRGEAWACEAAELLRRAADQIDRLRAELADARARGDGWRAKFNEDTDHIVQQRNELERLRPLAAIGAQWDDMRKRVASKYALLREKGHQFYLTEVERERLIGKAEGVDLALSFIDEHARMADGAVFEEPDCNCGWGGDHDPDNPRCVLTRHRAAVSGEAT